MENSFCPSSFFMNICAFFFQIFKIENSLPITREDFLNNKSINKVSAS